MVGARDSILCIDYRYLSGRSGAPGRPGALTLRWRSTPMSKPSTIMRCSSRPRTHAAHLDQLLADYSPTSKDAYRHLQENIRQAGCFDRYLIEMWISEERAAIDGAAGSSARPSRGFLDKRV